MNQLEFNMNLEAGGKESFWLANDENFGIAIVRELERLHRV